MLTGTCKCKVKYSAKKHNLKHKDGYYYTKCSDCFREVKMERGK